MRIRLIKAQTVLIKGGCADISTHGLGITLLVKGKDDRSIGGG